MCKTFPVFKIQKTDINCQTQVYGNKTGQDLNPLVLLEVQVKTEDF
jgi:hypothetical protein